MSELTHSAPIKGEELRDGIAVQKGVVITNEFLENAEELIQKWNNYFLLYPDHFRRLKIS